MPTKKMLLALVAVAVLFGVLLALNSMGYQHSRLLSSDVATSSTIKPAWVYKNENSTTIVKDGVTTQIGNSCENLCYKYGGQVSDQCYDGKGNQCSILNMNTAATGYYACETNTAAAIKIFTKSTGVSQTFGTSPLNLASPHACCCAGVNYSSSCTSSLVDGGLNPFTKGSVSQPGKADLYDKCDNNSKNLIDRFCTPGGESVYLRVDCSSFGGCSDGKCTTEPAVTPPALSFNPVFPATGSYQVGSLINVSLTQSGYTNFALSYVPVINGVDGNPVSLNITNPANIAGFTWGIPAAAPFVAGYSFKLRLTATNTTGAETFAISPIYTVASSAATLSCQAITGGVQVISGDETIYYLDNCTDNALHLFTCSGDIKNETVTNCSASQTCSPTTGCTTTSSSPSCAAAGQNYYRSAQSGPTTCCAGLVKKRRSTYVPGTCADTDSAGVCTTYNSGYCFDPPFTGGPVPEGSCVADASWNCGNGICDGGMGEDRCNCPEDCSSYDTSIDSEAEGQIVTGAPFTDISSLNSLEASAVTELYNRGIIGGYQNTDGTASFKGERSVNRAEASKFLIYTKYQGQARDDNVPTANASRETMIKEIKNQKRFVGSKEVRIGELLSDVVDDDWYAIFVYKAAEKGIINGYPDRTFRPADTVNTVEFLKMLNEAFGYNESKGANYNYVDVDGNAWYAKYLPAAYNCQLFPKRDPAYLDPAKLLTRTEVAVAIYNYFQKGCNSSL